MQRLEISDEVFDFLARRIDSVPHLEALLLFREQPGTAWTHADIAARVYVSRDKARDILQDLHRHGFITASTDKPDCWQYHSAWDESGLMDRVAQSYRRHLVHVAEMIHAKAESSSVHEFARAFKFRKKD
jgi:DNA-binding IclR family transcriptional regulator